jgi:xylan 1,4-beta-xylosidase
LKDKDSPAFVGRRQTSFEMTASAKISFVPVGTNEEAGLIVRGNDDNHFDLLITKFQEKRVVMLKKVLEGKVADVSYKEIPDGDIVLRISATSLQYNFWIQKEDKEPVLIGSAATKDLSTAMISGFIGAYIGMYASGNGSVNTNAAYFAGLK